MSPLSKLDKTNKRWFLIGSALIILLAITLLALDAERRSLDASRKALVANQRALDTANCVNDILGDRQDKAAADSKIYQELWAGVGDVLSASTLSKDAQMQVYIKFFDTLTTDIPILKANQDYRVAHPLGRC